MPAVVPPGALLPVIVELVTLATPSVMNIAPPCQAVDVLPLIVLLSTVALPSDAQPAGDVERPRCR